ncbi:hypothetical protein Tco_0890966 [Tanacetum coccineum]|uniref:Uncharacterized protein n=1 Tax=Tanacetum coccineum TaxID=301880 RepID=A0ABQ5C732_9ASTR
MNRSNKRTLGAEYNKQTHLYGSFLKLHAPLRWLGEGWCMVEIVAGPRWRWCGGYDAAVEPKALSGCYATSSRAMGSCLLMFSGGNGRSGDDVDGGGVGLCWRSERGRLVVSRKDA